MLKIAENLEKQSFTFFAFLPPYIGVSGSLVSRMRKISMRSIDWYRKFLISCLAARYSAVFCVFYCKNRFPKIKFAIEPCRREVLGRPVARYSAVFVFLSCARVLCAGLVRFSCAPSCAPKANYSTKHRNEKSTNTMCFLRSWPRREVLEY